MEAIYAVKRGRADAATAATVRAVAERLAAAGAEAIVAACTEIPLLLRDGDVVVDDRLVPVISSTDALVARTVAFATGAPRPPEPPPSPPRRSTYLAVARSPPRRSRHGRPCAHRLGRLDGRRHAGWAERGEERGQNGEQHGDEDLPPLDREVERHREPGFGHHLDERRGQGDPVRSERDQPQTDREADGGTREAQQQALHGHHAHHPSPRGAQTEDHAELADALQGAEVDGVEDQQPRQHEEDQRHDHQHRRQHVQQPRQAGIELPPGLHLDAGTKGAAQGGQVRRDEVVVGDGVDRGVVELQPRQGVGSAELLGRNQREVRGVDLPVGIVELEDRLHGVGRGSVAVGPGRVDEHVAAEVHIERGRERTPQHDAAGVAVLDEAAIGEVIRDELLAHQRRPILPLDHQATRAVLARQQAWDLDGTDHDGIGYGLRHDLAKGRRAGQQAGAVVARVPVPFHVDLGVAHLGGQVVVHAVGHRATHAEDDRREQHDERHGAHRDEAAAALPPQVAPGEADHRSHAPSISSAFCEKHASGRSTSNSASTQVTTVTLPVSSRSRTSYRCGM